MSYRLSLVDDPAAELRRCAREQLQDAIDQLESRREDDPVEAVHEARKSLKKTRAALRLARPALGRQSYRRENRALRDIGRAVSGVRDADVMVETVDGLKEHYSGAEPAETFTSVRRPLAEEARRAHDLDDDVVNRLVAQLKEAHARVDDWPLGDLDWNAIRRGATRSYRRARRARAVAVADPTTENLHEWRKRVKDLWYHERLLRNAWPGIMGAQAKEAHALSDALGDHHDLTVLAERIQGGSGTDGAQADRRDAALQLAARRRADLLELAVHSGNLLFAEPPKAYGRRLKRYLRAALEREPGLVAA